MSGKALKIGQTRNAMPKWKKGASEFRVKVGHHDVRGEQIYIPKPIVDLFGRPDYIIFKISGKTVTVQKGG